MYIVPSLYVRESFLWIRRVDSIPLAYLSSKKDYIYRYASMNLLCPGLCFSESQLRLQNSRWNFST